MNANKTKRKQKALEIMKKLDIYEPYINEFEKNDNVCIFEGFGGFWAWQRPNIIEKKKLIEERYDATCYAITHEITEIGEFYDFLLVTKYKSEWDYIFEELPNNNYYAFAFVWNLDDNNCSELGSVVIQKFGGGIRRIA